MPNLFDFLNSINKKTVYYSKDEDLKGYSIWMVNRFLVGEPLYAPVIAELNSTYILSDRMHYDFLYHALPKMNKFLKYTMKKEAEEKNLKYLMQFFNVDIERAKKYSTLISKEEFDNIIEHYEHRGAATPIKKKAKGKK
jgi:hypothetical protein